ncbi:MAG: LuxR C-terminal-related transcriptional regulator, partial [Rhodococcus sp. (in: high G+C Gram-positive bacteria)]
LTALRSDDPMGTLSRVGGTDRAVADYLMDEFIASLPETTTAILVATAIPDAVSASLAVHLTGRRQAHVVLEALAHDNFLLTRTIVDGEAVYSYHPMMRAYLRAESERLGDRTAHGVHRRLALWFLQQRQPFEALVSAIDSRDVATIDAVIESACVELILGEDRFTETFDLLDRAPLVVRARTTTRLVVAALQLVDGHRAPAAATLAAIDEAGTTVSAIDRALSAILRTQLTLRSGHANSDTMTTALRQLEALPVDQGAPGRYEFSATVALQETVIELTRGRLGHANDYLMQARDHTWAARSPMLELQCAAAATILRAFTGELGSVIEEARTALEIADEHAVPNSEAVYLAQTLATHARSLRREHASPEHGDALPWESLVDSVVPPLAEIARIVLGLTQATGTSHEIADLIRPRCTPDRDPLAPHMRAMFSPEIQHRFLASGNTSDAVAYAGHVRHKLGDCAESVLTAAMVQRYGRQRAKARATLAPILHGNVAPVHSLTLLWAWLEETASAADDTAASYSALCAALKLAAPEGLLLPFVYVHDEVRATLDRNRGRFGNLNTFAEVVRDAVRPSDSLSTVRLSPREMDLLRELPTFRTTDAIAADQFVSVNTVKTHLRGIYRKLGVSSRRDAIAAAQQLGLL